VLQQEQAIGHTGRPPSLDQLLLELHAGRVRDDAKAMDLEAPASGCLRLRLRRSSPGGASRVP
jgi:hypothetical protein